MESSRVQTLMREAIAAAKSGNKQWARECLSRILRVDPRNEEAWLWMSAILETPAEKKYCLEKVLAVNPNNVQAQAGLRYLQQQAQSTAKVTPIRRTICPMCGEPNDPKAFQCANCGQDLFVLCPSCGERVDIDRPACGACGQEIGNSRDGAGYFFHLGELYLQHGQPKRALEAWDKTLLLNPDYPRVAEVAAEAFMASGQRDLALQSLQRAIEEAKEDEHRRALRLRLANFHRDVGHFEEAGKIYQEILREDRERREPRADIYVELGRYTQQRGDREMARSSYEMALALDESLHEVRYSLAELLLQDGYEVRALGELYFLREVGGDVAARAAARIAEVRPPVSEEFRNRRQETVRGMFRYFVAGLVVLLLFKSAALAAGPDLNTINLANIFGLLTLLVGGYLVTAATATPRNLPTFEGLAELAESPLFLRLRRRKKGSIKPSLLQRFVAWQARSAQQLNVRLRVIQMRAIHGLRRAVEAMARFVERVRMSRLGRAVRALPETRFFRFLQRLGKTRFFRALGRFFQRLFPRGTGPSPWQRLRQSLAGGGKGLVERAGRLEFSGRYFYRWGAGLFGLGLLVLGAWLVMVW